MDRWRHPDILSSHAEEQKFSSPTGILAATSGNVQSFALDTKEGLENANPIGSGDLPQGRSSEPAPSQCPAPAPAPDTSFAPGSKPQIQLRLQARKHRREGGTHGARSRPDTNYLGHKKYQTYSCRTRRDTGDDGEVIWPPELEAAFQDALIAIPPMGRKKKSQNGKPNGRNELIAEWIFRATGKTRTRKQVSSHIQVLASKLKGEPEWEALRTVPDDPGDGTTPAQTEYYGNSIAVRVHEKYHGGPSFLGAGGSHHFMASGAEGLPPPASMLGSSTVPVVCRPLVIGLSFQMWVSPPLQTNQALHHYTRLQSTYPNSDLMPLESIRHWRFAYPHLSSILDSQTPADRIEVVFLEASFHLMADFPPRLSRLGINLELDVAALDETSDIWSCTTHLYQNGQYVQEPTWQDCQLVHAGKLKPTFESTWWANLFIKITEKKRRAEDLRDEAGVRAAEEESRQFFRGLSIMQELKGYGLKNGMQNESHGSRRTVILLWRFSQAPASYHGTTKWRRLIPPPERMATNSPPPTSAPLALPPLTMDTIVRGLEDATAAFGGAHEFLGPHSHIQYSLYAGGMGENASLVGHESFDMSFKSEGMTEFDDMQASLTVPSQHEEHISDDFHAVDRINFDLQSHELDVGHHDLGHGMVDDFFEPANDETMTEHAVSGRVYVDDGAEDVEAESSRLSFRPALTHFDHHTHQMLQASLGHHEATHGPAAHDEALRAALGAASAMSDLGAGQDLSHRPSPVAGDDMKAAGGWEGLAAGGRPSLHSHGSHSSQHGHVVREQEHMPLAANMDAFHVNQLAASASLISHDHDSEGLVVGGLGSGMVDEYEGRAAHDMSGIIDGRAGV